MSTNFYIQSSNPFVAQIHIGKRSAGWVFSFCGLKIKTLDGWKERLASLKDGETIVDEYGNHYTDCQFWQEVDATTKPWGINKRIPYQAYADCDNYRNWISDGFGFCGYKYQ